MNESPPINDELAWVDENVLHDSNHSNQEEITGQIFIFDIFIQ